MRCVHVHVSGRVQGVSFRASAFDAAKRFGLAGWVRNLPDGRVEAWFEGEDADVAAMIAWCHEGPIGATVTDVDVVDAAPTGASGFLVRR